MSSWEDALLLEEADLTVPNLTDFGPEHRRRCARVLSTAMILGEAEMVWTEALDMFRQRRQEHMADGTWVAVCQEFQRRQASRTAQGMTDGSKRLRSQSGGSAPPTPGRDAPAYGGVSPRLVQTVGPFGPPPPTPYNQPVAVEQSSASANDRVPKGVRPTDRTSRTSTTNPPTSTVTSSHGSAPGGPPPPTRATPESAQPRRLIPGTTVALPDDMITLETWGQNIVTFGKFAKAERTYVEMARDTEKSVVGYCKWVMEHTVTGGSKLKDFALYLTAMQQLMRTP